jgi:hypothetical protein
MLPLVNDLNKTPQNFSGITDPKLFSLEREGGNLKPFLF